MEFSLFIMGAHFPIPCIHCECLNTSGQEGPPQIPPTACKGSWPLHPFPMKLEHFLPKKVQCLGQKPAMMLFRGGRIRLESSITRAFVRSQIKAWSNEMAPPAMHREVSTLCTRAFRKGLGGLRHNVHCSNLQIIILLCVSVLLGLDREALRH